MSTDHSIASQLKDHLEHIRQAKVHASKVLDITVPGFKKAEDVMSHAWTILFDHFCELSQRPNIEELDKLSAIIHKLVMGLTQMSNIELKNRMMAINEDEYTHRKEKRENAQQPTLVRGIPKEVFLEYDDFCKNHTQQHP